MKRFVIQCPNCKWNEFSTGFSIDLQHLKEVKDCTKCGKPRRFRCPKCGMIAKMFKIKNNEI